ncbi:divergent protein kinase domain 2B isoform X3 [Danio rerio]|uniref:Divergent protein kinase domain 2B isoform X3 n=1 Tax=Danio rerio TaxID=7955 RepID=A0A8M3B5S2_DANRE|nr:deleted in autism-related protein 1 isoform X2 [Danio rerio]|eukprot:XP_009303084.1 deleted in autism-related protein 1 isoform X2 [Danio rerio]
MAGIWSGVWILCFILVFGTADPSPAPQDKSHDFRKIFLGLDKCNACIGTSICKKFFKDEIRFERRLTAQSNLSSADVRSYEGNYTDSTAGWRPVVVSRLMSPHLHQLSDNSICTSAGKGKSCSIEGVLRATSRFQTWVHSNLLLPSMVKMFPGTEGWPFLRYHGSCGRLMVWAASRALRTLFSSPLERRADLAYQLLHITQSLSANSLRFRLFYTRIPEDMFGILEDNKVFIVDTSTIGIIDLQEGHPPDKDLLPEELDVFSCLSGSCVRPPPCETVREAQSFILLCKYILNNLLTSNDKQSGLPRAAVDELLVCADPSQLDQTIIKSVQSLKNILKTLRPCSPQYAYRYPECLYSDKF